MRVVCGGLLYAKGEVDLSRHVVTFALAGLIATQRIPAVMIALIAAAGFTLSVFVSIQFVYVSLALMLLSLALVLRARGYPLIRIASAYTYELFLVNGVFLVAFSRLISGEAVASVFVALCVAILAAVALRYFVSYFSKVMPVYFRFRAS